MNMDLDKPAGILVKTTLIDFPGHVAGLFFLTGCNLQCPYCYNKALVIPETYEIENQMFISLNQLFAHLEKRKNVLSGLVISGGEPLLNPNLPVIIRKARETGYLIKLDTNGTCPDKLQELMLDPELIPDYIAMDFKTSPDKYSLLLKDSKNFIPEEVSEKLKKTIKLISRLPSDHREFRTVLVPGLVNTNDIQTISQYLPEDSQWFLAQFQNNDCLDPAYNNISGYSQTEAENLLKTARTRIPGAKIR